MRRIGAVLLVLSILITSLVGCGNAGEREFLPELDGAFVFSLSGTLCGVEMSAEVHVGAPNDTENGRVRAVSMSFTAPETLRGITVSCDSFRMDTHEAPNVTVTLDGMHMENSTLSGFLAPALLLAAAFETTESRIETRDRQKVTLLTATSCGNTRTVGIVSGQIVSLQGQWNDVWGEWEVYPSNE